MVNTAKLRWRIERDDEDLKQELGLGHDEGRGWRCLQRHATLCRAAYAFLISEREAVRPSGIPNALLREDIAFPTVTDPVAPSIRLERHVTNPIASIDVAIARAITRMLQRCPCCQRAKHHRNLRHNKIRARR